MSHIDKLENALNQPAYRARAFAVRRQAEEADAEIAALRARVEALEALATAVKAGDCIISLDDVDGRNWFDARDALLEQKP